MSREALVDRGKRRNNFPSDDCNHYTGHVHDDLAENAPETWRRGVEYWMYTENLKVQLVNPQLLDARRLRCLGFFE